jgi:hypothetical protein
MTVRIARTRWLGVLVGTSGLAFTSLSFAPAATAQVSAPKLTGQACLVGTWRNDGGTTAANFRGHLVTMHGGRGDVDHIYKNGADRDIFGSKAAALQGSFQHHKLYEVIRGTNKFTLRPVKNTIKVHWIEHGWTAGSKNTFTYRGHKYNGTLPQSGTFTFTYRCGPHTLVLRQSKRYVDTETRISRPPS